MKTQFKWTSMRALLTALAVTFSVALLSACGGGKKEDSQVTETRMDDIDSLEGTISDDMINTDESTDEGPYDAAPPAEIKAKVKDTSDEAAETEEATEPKAVDDPKIE